MAAALCGAEGDGRPGGASPRCQGAPVRSGQPSCRRPARLGAEGAHSGQGHEVPMGSGVKVLGKPSIE